MDRRSVWEYPATGPAGALSVEASVEPLPNPHPQVGTSELTSVATGRRCPEHPRFPENAVGASGGHLLTVLHAAESTGPPLLALQFLRWLRVHHPGWRTSTLVWDAGGDLELEFAALGPVISAGSNAPYTAGRRPHHRALVRWQLLSIRRRLGAIGPIDVAHIHCAGMMRARAALPTVPVLCHLHELETGLDLHLGPLAREHLAAADRYVAVSDEVREVFLSRYAVDPGRVDRQWGFVDAERLPTHVKRADLGVPADSFVVVSAGVRHWRKAPELFVRIALSARRQAPEIAWRFLWMGGTEACGLNNLVRKAGLDSLVTFLPHQPDLLSRLPAADAFILPAREDAFPLVCVEAAASGLPIVTFDNGGAAELVRLAKCGAVVPFPDVEAAAAELVALTRDPSARSALGKRARRFAREHLLLEQAGPALLASINSTRNVAP